MDAMPKRPWFRFSLRTLLVLVMIACAGFGWLADRLPRLSAFFVRCGAHHGGRFTERILAGGHS